MKLIIVLLILVCGAILAYIYSGVRNVAASSPDGTVTRWVVGTVREHSIATRIADIQVPSLADPKMIEAGFVHYNHLCTGCHLAPGMESTDLRSGLNPRPPILARAVPYSTPAKLFWITKNGIKMTGMPSWGQTHDDTAIWTIVAFLEKLPSLTPAEYQSMKLQAQTPGTDHAPAARALVPTPGSVSPPATAPATAITHAVSQKQPPSSR